jgi:hypothetical protein
MAVNSSAHSLRAGFNQSGGAYFVCVTPLCSAGGLGTTAVTTTAALVDGATPGAADPTHLYRIATPALNSGGNFVTPTLEPVSAQTVLGCTAGQAAGAATEFGAGQLIRDMGKTIVSLDGRTFRKFAVVGSRGVMGAAAIAPGAGYATFYLQVGREGQTGTAIPAPIARYF